MREVFADCFFGTQQTKNCWILAVNHRSRKRETMTGGDWERGRCKHSIKMINNLSCSEGFVWFSRVSMSCSLKRSMNYSWLCICDSQANCVWQLRPLLNWEYACMLFFAHLLVMQLLNDVVMCNTFKWKLLQIVIIANSSLINASKTVRLFLSHRCCTLIWIFHLNYAPQFLHSSNQWQKLPLSVSSPNVM